VIWANLLHLSCNMWTDTPKPETDDVPPGFTDHLRFDQATFDTVTEAMAEAGLTMLVLDVGDGIAYSSRPEISATGAWTREHLAGQLERLRSLGLDVVPKLNFSARHDAWLRRYSRMLSTPEYYDACADVIAEVCEAFEQPRFLHLGMDEETAKHQHALQYAVMRQHDLWWHDLDFLLDRTREAGVQPWVWSDYAWNHPEVFYERMPHDVMQSNWYYGNQFETDESGRPRPIRDSGEYWLTYLDLEDHGYDQIPTGSTWESQESLALTIDYCTPRIAPERLHGYLQTPWRPTLPQYLDDHLAAVARVGEAITRWQDHA